jgi:2-polyprenyl-3-methyl-5-hydroxy-6-metoxy-1,4-benzoquinol methylase
MPEGHYTELGCRVCGTRYVDSGVTEQYLDELQAMELPECVGKVTYEETAEGDRIRTAELAENWLAVASARPPQPGDKLLDYGSAWGALGTVAAKTSGVIPNGIELQPAAVAHSRTTWGATSVVYQGPIETAPFRDGEFEYVTSFETLEHVFDPIKVLKHLCRLTSDDGVVAVSMPSADYFAFRYWLYRKSPIAGYMRRKYPGNMEEGRVLVHNHLITPSMKSVKLMMKKAGLKLVHLSPYCSGLSGGRLGKGLKLAGKVLWVASFGRVAFAPSVFAIAVKDRRPAA